MLSNILLFALFSYGLSNLLVYGSGPFNILGKFRDFCLNHIKVVGEMLQCMMCTSANIGWVTSLVNLVLFPSFAFTPMYAATQNASLWPIIIFGDMCVSSGCVWLIHTIQEYFEGNDDYSRTD